MDRKEGSKTKTVPFVFREEKHFNTLIRDSIHIKLNTRYQVNVFLMELNE